MLSMNHANLRGISQSRLDAITARNAFLAGLNHNDIIEADAATKAAPEVMEAGLRFSGFVGLEDFPDELTPSPLTKALKLAETFPATATGSLDDRLTAVAQLKMTELESALLAIRTARSLAGLDGVQKGRCKVYGFAYLKSLLLACHRRRICECLGEVADAAAKTPADAESRKEDREHYKSYHEARKKLEDRRKAGPPATDILDAVAKSTDDFREPIDPILKYLIAFVYLAKDDQIFILRRALNTSPAEALGDMNLLSLLATDESLAKLHHEKVIRTLEDVIIPSKRADVMRMNVKALESAPTPSDEHVTAGSILFGGRIAHTAPQRYTRQPQASALPPALNAQICDMWNEMRCVVDGDLVPVNGGAAGDGPFIPVQTNDGQNWYVDMWQVNEFIKNHEGKLEFLYQAVEWLYHRAKRQDARLRGLARAVQERAIARGRRNALRGGSAGDLHPVEILAGDWEGGDHPFPREMERGQGGNRHPFPSHFEQRDTAAGLERAVRDNRNRQFGNGKHRNDNGGGGNNNNNNGSQFNLQAVSQPGANRAGPFQGGHAAQGQPNVVYVQGPPQYAGNQPQPHGPPPPMAGVPPIS